jgi:MFS family permease
LSPTSKPAAIGPPSEDVTPLTGWRKTFSAFRSLNYRYFFFGQSISLIGTWGRSMAWGWLAYQATKSEFWTGVVFTLNSIPILIFSNYAGSLADRIPKLRIFMVTSFVALLASLTLAIILFNSKGSVSIGLLMIFVAAWGLCMAFEMPARQSMIVELVGKKDLVNAIALNSAMVNSAKTIGPGIGGVLYGLLGPAWCFLVDAVSFLAVIYSIFRIKITQTTHVRTSKVDLKYYLEGFRYLRQNPPLARTILLLFVMSLGGWAYLSQLPAYVEKQIQMNVQGYGWIFAMNSLGACTAALTVATLGASLVRERSLYAGIGIFGFFILLFGFQHNPIGAAFMLFFAGFGITLFFSVANSFIQSHSPDHLRGRIMGIWALVFGGGMPFGSLWMGVLASRTGSGTALQVGGIFCVAGASAIYVFLKRNR